MPWFRNLAAATLLLVDLVLVACHAWNVLLGVRVRSTILNDHDLHLLLLLHREESDLLDLLTLNTVSSGYPSQQTGEVSVQLTHLVL